MRLIMSVLVLVMTASVADAGPLLDRLRERRGGCQTCPQQSSVQSSGAVTYTLTGGSCANGQCPVPQSIQPAQVVLPGSNAPAKK